jgi:hypothetical protein
VSSGQIVDRGTNPLVGATVLARNSGSSNPRQTLFPITNSILDNLEENAIVGSTISTLNRYKNMIMHAAFSDQKFGLEVTPVARGNVNWIGLVVKSLQKIKKNLRTNLINLNHLRNINRHCAEYQIVANAIKCKHVSNKAVLLVAWIVTENPSDEALSPTRYPNGGYESENFRNFKLYHD